MNEEWKPNRVLITGAAGSIGRVVRRGLRGYYPHLRLMDISDLGVAEEGEELVQASILDDEALSRAMKDVDCVVHLAGINDEDNWETVLTVTIDGSYRVFEAARLAGVRRVVYASSNHAIGFYRRDQKVGLSVPLRVDGRYGVSKAFGEALGRLYADKYGMSVSCMRIGSFREKPEDVRQLMTWISHRDTIHLARRCIEYPHYHFFCIYGVSNNDRNLWDNSEVDWLDFTPRDNAEDYADEILGQPDIEDEVAKLFHGGRFASVEFAGNPDLID